MQAWLAAAVDEAQDVQRPLLWTDGYDVGNKGWCVAAALAGCRTNLGLLRLSSWGNSQRGDIETKSVAYKNAVKMSFVLKTKPKEPLT